MKKATTQYAYYKKRLWLQRNKGKIVASYIIVLLAIITIFTMIKQNEVIKQNAVTISKENVAEEKVCKEIWRIMQRHNFN